MISLERRVPGWLGFHWGWILAASVVAEEFSGRLQVVGTALDCVIMLWPLVQAGWLRKVLPQSVTIYWFAGELLIAIGFQVAGPTHGLPNDWRILSTELLATACYLTGNYQFVREMRRYVDGMETYKATISLWRGMVLGTIYFQYKLHEVYADQLLEASRDGQS